MYPLYIIELSIVHGMRYSITMRCYKLQENLSFHCLNCIVYYVIRQPATFDATHSEFGAKKPIFTRFLHAERHVATLDIYYIRGFFYQCLILSYVLSI